MNFVSSITLAFKDAFSAGFAQANNSLAGMQGALGQINQNQSMNRLAADLALATSLTDPFRQKLSALIDEPSKLAGTFDSSLRNIQSLTNETNESLSETGKRILEIGGNSVAGPNAAAAAFYNIASGVGRAEVRFDMLNAAMALSEAGQANLQAATSGLISVVNAYNTPSENMTDLSDVFFQTVRKGVGSLDGFVSAMSSISGISASVGIGFDELGSSMAFITAKGQTESVAATQLKAAMVSLLRPNEELSKALASIGISSGSAMLEQFGLAESLNMVKAAVGGSQDKMAKALGSVEALQAAVALTADDYGAFAASYAGGLSGATSAALEAQAQSYEARVAKLQAAQESLKIQIGDDVNAIKGFFVDIGAGFLTNVAAPLMSSPVGEVLQRLTAGAAIAAKGVLDIGSGALNTASQLVTMTAAIQNAGGFANLFRNTLSLLGSPFRAIGSLVSAAIPAIAAFGASLWAAAGPILLTIAAVAALAIGGYMLIKHWDAVSAFFVNLWGKITGAFTAAFNWIKNLLAGVSNKVLVVISVFLPFIGIPALIIKNWDTIKAFFIGLWVQVAAVFTAAWTGIVTFFSSVWASITTAFTTAWTYISQFFSFVWDSMVGVVISVANWFSGVWGAITGGFAAAWQWISDLFFSVWENIKGVVMGFVAWLQPVIDIIIAPFRAIGNVIGGIINTVGGWFGDTVDNGKTELAKINESKAAAQPVLTAAAPTTSTVAAAVAPPVISGAGAIAPPGAAGKSAIPIAAPMQTGAPAIVSGIQGMDSPAISRAASSAWGGVEGDSASFADAVPRIAETMGVARTESALQKQSAKAPTITIQNLTVNADDIQSAFDFIKVLMNAANVPQEAAV